MWLSPFVSIYSKSDSIWTEGRSSSFKKNGIISSIERFSSWSRSNLSNMSSTRYMISISLSFISFCSPGSESFTDSDLKTCIVLSSSWSISLNTANTCINSSVLLGSLLNYISKATWIPCNSFKLPALSSVCLRAYSNTFVSPFPKSYAFASQFTDISVLSLLCCYFKSSDYTIWAVLF